MREALLRLIQAAPDRPSDDLFNEIALPLFQYQFECNPAYRRFCLLQKKGPDTVRSWEEIPPLPVTAFKVAEVACRPIGEARRIFHSSGTTLTGMSRHFLFDLEISRAAILSHFARHLMPEGEKMVLAILAPSPEEAPHSSLSHMMEVIREAFGAEGSRYYIEKGRLQGERLAYELAEAGAPVCLLGTSFSFVHFIDFHEERAFPCSLPAGSRLMDTGGFKGRSRTVSQHWLYAMFEKRLGIPVRNCINEYGMSEMTSQFYDGRIGSEPGRVYQAPPQLRTRFLHPETLKPVEKGEAGLLAHVDLANIDSAAALLTEDLGKEVDGGFVLLGRAPGAAMKGCSLSLDDLLKEGSSRP